MGPVTGNRGIFGEDGFLGNRGIFGEDGFLGNRGIFRAFGIGLGVGCFGIGFRRIRAALTDVELEEVEECTGYEGSPEDPAPALNHALQWDDYSHSRGPRRRRRSRRGGGGGRR